MGQVVAGRDDDDEVCRAHERADDPAHGVDTSTDETTATVTASVSMDTATPHEAKATRDQCHQPATSTSAPSVSRDHPGHGMTRNPPRPSEDPADAMGNNEHRPDAPTEPPDKPKGMRRRWGEERAEMGVSEMSGVSRGSAWGTGDDGVETRRVMKPSKAQVESRDPTGVQVKPGGETNVERNGSAMHEDTDMTVNGIAEEAHSGMQDEAERLATCRNVSIEGERGSALAQGQLMTTDKEDNQHSETSVDDIPEDPPDPSPSPDQPVQ